MLSSHAAAAAAHAAAAQEADVQSQIDLLRGARLKLTGLSLSRLMSVDADLD